MTEELEYQHREQVIWSLELFASREQQLEYERTVPIADVLGEMFCEWDDVFTNRKDLSRHFSPDEWESLVAFDKAQKKVLKVWNKGIFGIPFFRWPTLAGFMESPHSAELAEAAAKALQTITPPTVIP